MGYGSGDIAGNVVYAFLSTFVMIYLTNTVGLNPGAEYWYKHYEKTSKRHQMSGFWWGYMEEALRFKSAVWLLMGWDGTVWLYSWK